jgi:hypothetical protein
MNLQATWNKKYLLPGVEMTGRKVAKCDQLFNLATRHLPTVAVVASEKKLNDQVVKP